MNKAERRERPYGEYGSLVQRPLDAIKDYVHLIRQARPGDTVFAQSMNFSLNDHLTGILREEWKAAAQRGVKVQLNMESYALRLIDDKYDLHTKRKDDLNRPYYLERFRQNRQMIADLMAHGVDITILDHYRHIKNRPLPIGRDHSKMFGVLSGNGQSYAWLPGFNFFDEGIGYGDLCMRFEDQRIIQAVYSVFSDKNGKRKGDQLIPCTPHHQLLVAAGNFPGRSVIHQYAYELLNRKDIAEVMITSQFPLDPKMALTLRNAALRGSSVMALLSQPDKMFHSPVGKLLHAINSIAENATPNLNIKYFTDGKVHAKVLYVCLQDGTTIVMQGSDNLFMAGAAFLTKEIEMVSTEQQLNEQVKQFVVRMAYPPSDGQGGHIAYQTICSTRDRQELKKVMV